MLSVPLLVEDMRENRKNWFLYTGILSFLMLLFVMTFQSAGGSRMEDLFCFLPEKIRQIFSLELTDDSLIGVLGTYLYSFWFLLLPMIYTVGLSYHLIAWGMKSGSMICCIGSPLGRSRVIFTKGYFLMFSQFCMIGFLTVLGIALSELFFPGRLEIPQFLLLNISMFCLHFALGGMEFFFSCTGLSEKLLLSLLAGLPVFAFLLHLLGNLKEGMEVFGYLSLFSVFDLEMVLKGDFSLLFRLPLLLIFGGVFYGLAFLVFKKRDLKFGCDSSAAKRITS